MEIQFKPTIKQFEAWEILNDKTTTELLWGGGSSGGKAQPLDSLISTPFGFRKMGDMKVGQMIHHPSGSLTKVIAVYPQGEKEIVRITFSDDSYTECCLEHLWLIWEGRRKSKFTIKTGIDNKVATTEQIEKLVKSGRNIYIPMTEPIQYTSGKKNKFILHPYILGILLGDGGLTSNVRFTSADEEIVNRVKLLLPNDYQVNKLDSSKYEYSITYNGQRGKRGNRVNPIKEELIKIGLMGKKSEYKFIPKYYFTSDINDRWELVKGLMDSDGYVDNRGHISFSTSSDQLAIDIRKILMSLGFKVTNGIKTSGYKKDGIYIPCLKSNQLYINGRHKHKLFSLGRKIDRVVDNVDEDRRIGRRIVSIDRIGKKEAQCIKVSAPDGLYLTNDYIVTHNTYFGCAWIIISSLKYAGSRHLIGRSKLTSLKLTTLKTFNDILKEWNLTDRFKLNNQSNTIYVDNGSEIILKDLFSYPSDPNFDSLGSLELTSVFIDEASQISYKAFEIIQTRIRYKLKEFDLIPKLLMTCNPSHGFLYSEFYKPWTTNTLLPYRKFMPVLAVDNPHTDPSYIEQLRKASNTVQQRLLFGNWDFDSDIDSMFKYEDLIKLRENITPNSNGKRYISADIARLGKDKTLIMVWNDLTVIDMLELEQVTTDISTQHIRSLMTRYHVNISNVIVDSDGVGGGVVDNLKGCKAFINNSKPIEVPNEPNNYSNLKSQCYYKLSEMVELEKIKMMNINDDTFDDICQELQVIKQKDIDMDGKLSVIPKDIIKKIIGRSPDYADCLMMRMIYELKPKSDISRMRFY